MRKKSHDPLIQIQHDGAKQSVSASHLVREPIKGTKKGRVSCSSSDISPKVIKTSGRRPSQWAWQLEVQTCHRTLTVLESLHSIYGTR